MCLRVVKDLRTRAAGTIWSFRDHTRRPVIIVFALAKYLSFRHPCLDPQTIGLFIVLIHRHANVAEVQLQDVKQKFPGIGDRFGFEIVAKGEVAQHLEKRAVARVADIFNIRRSEALLRRRRPNGRWGLQPQKIGLELHHSR